MAWLKRVLALDDLAVSVRTAAERRVRQLEKEKSFKRQLGQMECLRCGKKYNRKTWEYLRSYCTHCGSGQVREANMKTTKRKVLIIRRSRADGTQRFRTASGGWTKCDHLAERHSPERVFDVAKDHMGDDALEFDGREWVSYVPF